MYSNIIFGVNTYIGCVFAAKDCISYYLAAVIVEVTIIAFKNRSYILNFCAFYNYITTGENLNIGGVGEAIGCPCHYLAAFFSLTLHCIALTPFGASYATILSISTVYNNITSGGNFNIGGVCGTHFIGFRGASTYLAANYNISWAAVGVEAAAAGCNANESIVCIAAVCVSQYFLWAV